VKLGGVISGTGALVADGGGSIYLNGVNTYSGGTTIVDHTAVYFGSDSALGAASGPVTIENGSLNATANVSTSRNIVIFQDGQLNSNGNTLTSNGEIDEDLNGQLTPLLIGNAALTGELVYQASSGFTVEGGTLLRGVGTYYTPLTVYGTVAPGNSPGTMIYLAPVVITSSGTLSIDIDGTGTGTGAGNYSRLIVAGAGNSFTAGGTLTPKLRGITGSATNTYTPPLTQSFDIVSASGGVTGQFATLVQPTGLQAGTRFDTIYSQNDITLWVTPGTYTDLSALGETLTSNQKAVGSGLDALRPPAGQRTDPATSAVLQTLYAETAAQLPTQLNALSGQVYGEGMRYGLAKADETRNHVADAVDDQLAMRAAGAEDPNARIGRLWVTGAGSRTDLNSATGKFSYGMVGGWDRWWRPNLLAGFGIAGSSGSLREVVNGDQLKADNYALFGYLVATQGANVFSGQFGANYASARTTRSLLINSANVTGKAHGYGYDVMGQLEHRFDMGQVSFSPLVRLSSDQVSRDALDETGSSVIGLHVNSATNTSTRTLVGFAASTVWGSANTRYALTGRAGWGHEFGDVNFDTTQAFEGDPGASFVTSTARPGRDGAVLSLSQSVQTRSGLSFSIQYRGDLRPRQTSQTGMLSMAYQW